MRKIIFPYYIIIGRNTDPKYEILFAIKAMLVVVAKDNSRYPRLIISTHDVNCKYIFCFSFCMTFHDNNINNKEMHDVIPYINETLNILVVFINKFK